MVDYFTKNPWGKTPQQEQLIEGQQEVLKAPLKIEPIAPKEEEKPVDPVVYEYSDDSTADMVRQRQLDMIIQASYRQSLLQKNYEASTKVETKEPVDAEVKTEPNSQTTLEQEADSLSKILDEMTKGEVHASFEQIVYYLCQLFILRHRISNDLDRRGMQEMTNQLYVNIEKQVKTYDTKWQMGLTIASTILQGTAAVMALSPIGGANLFGITKLPTATLAGASQVVSGVGGSIDKFGNIIDQSQAADRTKYKFEEDITRNIQNDFHKGTQNAKEAEKEAFRIMQQLMSSHYDMVTKATSAH